MLVAERALEDFAPEAGSQRSAGRTRCRRPDGRAFAGNQPASPDDRKGRRRRTRASSITGAAGSGKELAARTHSRPVGARERSLRRHQRADDDARAAWRRSCSASRAGQVEGRRGRRARGGARRHALHRRNRRHAARDAGQDPPGSGRSELSARRRRHDACMSMCASFRRRAAIWRRRSPRGVSAKTCFTALAWCRFAFRRSSERREDIPELDRISSWKISAATGPAAPGDRRRRHGGASDRTTGRETSASCATMSSG